MAALIDLTVKATLLIVLAAAAVFLMRRASAASRHAMWTAVFSAVLLLPVARFTLPVIRVPVLAPDVRPMIPTAISPVAVAIAATGAVGQETRPSIDVVASTATTPFVLRWRAVWSNGRLVTGIWLVVAGLIGLRILLGAVANCRLARRAQPVANAMVVSRLHRIRASLRVRRPIRLLVSCESRMPITWGALRPVILLPPSAVTWAVEAPTRLEAVLAHEAAHIARWDAVSQLIIRLGVAMFWFNPLMWIAARHARLDRERACDDAVLALGTRPSDYAGHLLATAQFLPSPEVVGASGLAMARHSQLERRVRAVLDERMARDGTSRARLGITSLLVVAVLPVSAVSLTARQAEIVPLQTVLEPATPPEPRPLPTPVGQVQKVAAVVQVSKVATSKPARFVPDASGPLPTLAPIEIQSSPLPQIPTGGFSAATWREDRARMLQQLRDRARQHFRDNLSRWGGDTMASIETLTSETIVVNLEAAIATDNRAGWTYVPSDSELARLTSVFDVALRNLDAEERRMAAGVTTSRNVGVALMTAVNVLLSVRPTTDEALVAALRDAAAIPSGTDRANALLTIAQRNALSPEMVSLYVAAANGIASESERARVFGQPIRVKP